MTKPCLPPLLRCLSPLLFLCILIGAISSTTALQAQTPCNTNEVEVRVEVSPDEFTANETGWILNDPNGTVWLVGSDASQSVCVSDTACLNFTITDLPGDGILPPAYCRLYYADQLQYEFTTFGMGAHVELGSCAEGSSCFFPINADTGIVYTAPRPDIWYLFDATESGHYQISTCGLGNICTGSIWVYEYCMGLPWNESPSGTLYFSSTGCDGGANVNAIFEAGSSYYLRIGDMADNCANQSIDWVINYNGQITGCMDPTACNYNPVATLNNPDICLYSGNPDCPTAPDLAVVREDIISSFSVIDTWDMDNCSVAEGCVTGYGARRVITFTMHIQNIGDKDYYIGAPPEQPAGGSTQFEFSPCHGHWHYKGYAAYLLFDQQGHPMPAGFKNGFCVMDLECWGGGTAKYGCGDQGISAGCGDIYGAGTGCQWVDITDVPDGLYTLVTLVNWDNSPDITGAYELDMSNNWAQICIAVSTDGAGVKQAAMVPDCWQFSDCTGDTYGNAQYDCMGICGGMNKIGDIDYNGQLHTDDVLGYVMGILDNNISPIPCNDANADGIISITDAALINACIKEQNSTHTDPLGTMPHSHCSFPTIAATNPNDSVWFEVAQFNPAEQFFDIAVYSPLVDLLGYDLEVSGIQIAGVVNLYVDSGYAVDLLYNANGRIIGFSTVESPINRSALPITFLRVYYSAITAAEICLESHTALNNYYQETIHFATGCATVEQLTQTTTALNPQLRIHVVPNPFGTQTTLQWHNPDGKTYSFQLIDTNGNVLQHQTLNNGQLVIHRNSLPAGIYYYRLTNYQGTQTGKLMIY